MFAKVFSQILDSSLAEDWKTRLVFEDMLKLSDKDGVVDITRESIARRTNVPLDIVAHGISQLELPDKTSRTPDHEGRRIVRLDEHRDWGWKIVNYVKYRESATKEMLRMAEADRKKEWRRRKGFPHTPSQTTKEVDTDTDMSRHVPKTSGHVPDKTRFTPPSLDEIKLACAKTGLPDDEAVKFHAYYQSNGWRVGRNPMKCWKSALTHWKTNYQTWSKNGHSTAKPNPRNHGITIGPTDFAAAAARRQQEQADRIRQKGLVGQTPANGTVPSPA